MIEAYSDDDSGAVRIIRQNVYVLVLCLSINYLLAIIPLFSAQKEIYPFFTYRLYSRVYRDFEVVNLTDQNGRSVYGPLLGQANFTFIERKWLRARLAEAAQAPDPCVYLLTERRICDALRLPSGTSFDLTSVRGRWDSAEVAMATASAYATCTCP